MKNETKTETESETKTRSDVLCVRDLTCLREGKTILNQVGFTIQSGDFVALVGPNGAGKSTLLKCLMRLIPTAPCTQILFSGTEIQRLTAREMAKRTAYVPQAQNQNFPFTVRNFISAARYAHQSPWDCASEEDKNLCDQALTEIGLCSFADRELSTLSGGELQKVWLAGALAQNTPMLMLDETTSQMDYRARQETSALLQRLNREQGKTILTITHDINEAAQNAGRILALKQGNLMFDGTAKNFLQAEVLEELYETHFLLASVPELELPVVLPSLSDSQNRKKQKFQPKPLTN